MGHPHIEWTKEMNARLAERANEGASHKDLSELFGLSPATIMRQLRYLREIGEVTFHRKRGQHSGCNNPNGRPARVRAAKANDGKLCSTCRKHFTPESRFIFTCDNCKQTEVWQVGGCSYSVAA